MIDLDALLKYFSRQGTVMLLESQSNDHPWSRKSYLAALPKAEIKAINDRIEITSSGKSVKKVGNPWEALADFRRKHNNWFFGYLGYDLKNHLEKLTSCNPDKIGAPDMHFMLPGFLLEVNRVSGEAEVLVGNMPQKSALNTISEKNECYTLSNFESQISQHDYLSIIKEAQQRIYEGDFYEINVSHQMGGKFRGSPVELYKEMKRIGPIPFGAYFETGDLAVCCQSPERFLRKQGDSVFSQPIKGTSQRGENQSTDQRLRQQLLSSEKERAENLMIVDLVRNDLSRIAKIGSVEVPELFNIQSFGTVHQMVSTVKAEAKEKDPIEILKACFPMGSMTGAPKISAMKTIEELENYRRGLYSGAIGYITPTDDFDFNVVIRTAIIRNQNLFYSVGGAVTSDSDPLQEWEETQVKARALMDVIQIMNT